MGTFSRLRAALQDRLWAADEVFAAERGWTARRSSRGWSIDVRDPRWDCRQECSSCRGEGREPITGRMCTACDGIGVVTLGPAEERDAG